MSRENLITRRVAQAQRGENPYVITRMRAGWLVIGDVQPLPGYCVFLSDPVVTSINDLGEPERAQYSLDTLRAGDAILAATGAERMNYETLCNSEPALHTHLIPRFADEPPEKRRLPAMMSYSWPEAPAFDPAVHGAFVGRVRAFLGASWGDPAHGAPDALTS